MHMQSSFAATETSEFCAYASRDRVVIFDERVLLWLGRFAYYVWWEIAREYWRDDDDDDVVRGNRR